MKDELNTIADFLREVDQGNENIIDVARKVCEDGAEKVSMALGRRALQPEPPTPPQRAETPARRHSFNDVDGFLCYLQKHGSDNLVILGDVDARVIHAVLDETAGHGVEIVTLQPVLHPLFAPWARTVLGKSVPASMFAEFVMANRRTVMEPNGMDLAVTLRQLTVSASITIQKGSGPKSINGVMVTMEVMGSKQEVPVELPNTIKLFCPLLVGTPEQEVEIDLLVAADHRTEQVNVLSTSSGVEAAMFQAFEAMLAKIGIELAAKKAVVSTGRPAHTEWKYLK